ncbi:MAG TPA: UbiA family prenyltransferase [Candidatus Methanoperedenaceae archaeon]|nr:UbiA family prenyltransferase [Candidatus Methanoperedenaceae archaeon]
MNLHKPTLRLLCASMLVGISGAFKLHITFLFLGIAPDARTYLAGFLIIYATYTLDRAMDCEEDKVNRKDLASSRKDIAIAFCLFSFALGSWLLYQQDLLAISFIPIFSGYLYSKGLALGSRKVKLKGNFGMKNLAVSLTWGLFISGIVQRWADIGKVLFFVFPFFTIKSFINTVIYDFRDVKGDAIAGIKTLPICLGEGNTRKLLQFMHIVIHLWIAASMLLNFINPEVALLVTFFSAGIIYTGFLTKSSPASEPRIRKLMRDAIVDGEFIMALLIKTVTGF